MARKKPGRPPGSGVRSEIKNPMEMSAPLPQTIKNPDIVIDPGEYHCVCCGKGFAKQQGNFYRAGSPLFRGNNKYLPVCISCVNNLFLQYVELLGSEEEAVQRLCQRFDIYFSDAIFKKSEIPKIGQSTRMSEYIKLFNTSKSLAGYTYDTYLKELKDHRIMDPDPANEDESVPSDLIDRFGIGYSASEYRRMGKQYEKILSTFEGEDDPNFNELAKVLCTTQVFMDRAMVKDDLDAYDKATKLHQATLKSMQWKPEKPKADASEDSFTTIGQMRAMIEQYCPSVVYKDKNLYRDVDDIEGYWKRFIVRPFKNFFTGSSDKDAEYSVGESEE